MSDAELIARIQRGDAEALASLYDRHVPTMLALACRMLDQRRDAEDLVHDVFIEAWERAGTYDSTRASVRTWLLLRLRSRAIDRLRERRSSGTLFAHRADATWRSFRGSDVGPDVVAECARARRAVESLTSVQREAIELAYFSGLTPREIAEHCQIPIGTVKSRTAAGLAALRRALDIMGTEG